MTLDASETPITMDALRERVRSIISDAGDGQSQAQVARESGIAAPTLSQFLSNTYNGDNNKIAEKLVAWLRKRGEGERLASVVPVAPRWIETPTARLIQGALSYAQLMGDIALVYGGAGFGKTRTLERYADQNPNVWVVTAAPATASSTVILQEIAITLGLKSIAPHPATLHRAIVERIKATGGLLVVDEAQHLSKPALEACRAIHDKTEVGLALLGNAAVFDRIYGGGKNGFAQFFSRIGKRVLLTTPKAGDVHAIAKFFNVTGTTELKQLEEIARRPGALRAVVKTLRLAAVLASGVKTNATHIRAAWDDLQGVGASDEEAA